MKLLVILTAVSNICFATASLEHRVQELELNKMLNVFKFSTGLKTQSHIVESTGGDEAQINRMQAWLDTYAKASKNLRFYSRMEVFKYFNTSEISGGADNTPLPADVLLPAQAQDDRGLYLARAYVDFIIPNTSLIFSLGRLPTLNGPPSHKWDQSSRKSTYPILSYNGQLDGVALSYNFWAGNSRLTARAVYAPFSHVNFDDRGQIPIGTPTGGFGDKRSVDHTITALLEYERKDPNSIIPNSLGLVQYTKLKNVSFEDVLMPVSTATGTAISTTPVLEFPKDMADIDFLTFYGELNNIANMGLSFNATFMLTHVFNRKLLRYMSSQRYGIISDHTGSTIGRAALFGVTQNLSFGDQRAPLVGAELMWADKKAMLISFYGTQDDITGFYATSGASLHLYYFQPILNSLSIRIGYRHQGLKWRSDPAKLTLGGRVHLPNTIRSLYMNILFKI